MSILDGEGMESPFTMSQLLHEIWSLTTTQPEKLEICRRWLLGGGGGGGGRGASLRFGVSRHAFKDSIITQKLQVRRG